MAQLPFTVGSRDEIPDGLGDYYEETDDGGFRLNVTGENLKTTEDTKRLKKTLDKVRDERDEAQKQLKQYPDDFDPDHWDKVKNLDPDSIDDPTERERKLQEQVDSLKKRLEDKDEQIQTVQQKSKQTIKRSKVRDALHAAGVTDDVLLDAATDRVLKNHRISVEENDSGTYQVLAGDLDEPVEQWATKQWATSDEGKRFVSANGNQGAGARNDGAPTSSDNPWSDEAWNVTKQAQIKKQNPDKARRLANEAGRDVSW